MRHTLSLHTDRGDQPRSDLINSHGLDLAQIHLSDGLYGVTLCSTDPDYLRALARTCDEAAVRLSAALDTRTAARLNATAGAA